MNQNNRKYALMFTTAFHGTKVDRKKTRKDPEKAIAKERGIPK